ncbi:brefeldin A-inhibited guanine nucleotide-exchange protein 3-like [Xyrichtys novacula]|uniref:Brefeldin A-inhibited guanine nucleotide-exchange protein 3-like n=1 Tax=Xyrichtys novacula TaxID=13765 RepID=A0AAV1G760_XYRNO|nr:brefeldin A-inhibited guanine nucleotide-exchange protein 3-like [Xyrichtys novacula]
MEPKFRRRGDGRPSLFDSEDARRVKAENRPWAPARSAQEVRESAKMAVVQLGGDPANELHLLGQHQMQFGQYAIQVKLEEKASKSSTKPATATTTQPSTSSQPSTSTSPRVSSASVSSLQSLLDSVGPDNIEGFTAVQGWADHLFQLKDHSLSLSREEAAHIISLWERLSDYDKGPTVYAPRHQVPLPKGRFRATKKIVVPGVESTKRCFAAGRSAAQWPDCNRVCESLFVELCEEYRGPRRIDGVRHERWSLVTRAYLHIRQVILNNAAVMEGTTIQLPVVNSATIASWYCKRERRQDMQVLEQRISAPNPATVSPESLPPAVERKGNASPTSRLYLQLRSHHSRLQHKLCSLHPILLCLQPDLSCLLPDLLCLQPDLFACTQTSPACTQTSSACSPTSPACTPTSSACSRPPLPAARPLLPAPRPPLPAARPFLPAPRPLLPAAHPSLPTPQPMVSVRPAGALPYTTQLYHKRKHQEEEKTGKTKRSYTRKTSTITCKQCQKERDPATHQQYFGNWYCQATATMTLAEWRATLEARGYGKKSDKKQ